MIIPHYLANFFAGMFLCNAIPHLTAGVQGDPFPTPFAKPPGIGNSSPLVNFLWSVLNLLVGVFLIWLVPISWGLHISFGLCSLGFIVMGMNLSHYFGKTRRDTSAASK
jgi:hypothetical protein